MQSDKTYGKTCKAIPFTENALARQQRIRTQGEGGRYNSGGEREYCWGAVDKVGCTGKDRQHTLVSGTTTRSWPAMFRSNSRGRRDALMLVSRIASKRSNTSHQKSKSSWARDGECVSRNMSIGACARACRCVHVGVCMYWCVCKQECENAIAGVNEHVRACV